MNRNVYISAIIILGILGWFVFKNVYSTSQKSEVATSPQVTDNVEVPEEVTQENNMQLEKPELNLEESRDYFATLKTNMGDIKIKLYAKQTPITVNNFVFLAEKNFYDGQIFHRVIADFMLQGGDPTGTGTGGPGYKFEDEIVSELVFDKAGLLAMANSGPATNGSQFFITLADTSWLNGNHTIFGEVVEGMDVVEKMGAVETAPGDRPLQEIKIETIKISEN